MRHYLLLFFFFLYTHIHALRRLVAHPGHAGFKNRLYVTTPKPRLILFVCLYSPAGITTVNVTS